MKTLAAAALSLIAALPCFAAQPSARQVVDGAGAKIKTMAGQRWVTPGMKRLVGAAFATIDGYAQIGGGVEDAGHVDASHGVYATIPVGERVHLSGGSTTNERGGAVREHHHVGASLDITALEVRAGALDARSDFGRTRVLDVRATLVPRPPANARERRLADRHGLYWPGTVNVAHRLHEPGAGRTEPATMERSVTRSRADRVTDRGGVVAPLDLAEPDAAASLAGQLARARAARAGKLTPVQRAAMTRALGEVEALLARGDYTLTHRVEEELNDVVATFPGGQRLRFTTMDLAGQRGTIELTDGARSVKIAHDEDHVQVDRTRPRTFAAGPGHETNSLTSSLRLSGGAHVERVRSIERPLGAAEAARVAGE